MNKKPITLKICQSSKLEHRQEEIVLDFKEAALDKNDSDEFKLWDQFIDDGIDETNEYVTT